MASAKWTMGFRRPTKAVPYPVRDAFCCWKRMKYGEVRRVVEVFIEGGERGEEYEGKKMGEFCVVFIQYWAGNCLYNFGRRRVDATRNATHM